jgi:hypothetical protein
MRVWRGKCEGQDSGDGRRVYRLRWETRDRAAIREYRLSEREILGGMFIRYLIDRGKLSELWQDPAAPVD